MKNFFSFLFSFLILFQILNLQNVYSANFVLKLNGSFSDLEVSEGEIFTLELGGLNKTGTGKLTLRDGLIYTGAIINGPTISGNDLIFPSGFNFSKIELIGTQNVSNLKVGFDTNGDLNYTNDFSNSVNITVSNNLRINSAEYLDSDSNGKLDSVKITFNQNVTGDKDGFSISNYGCTNSRTINSGSVSNSDILTLNFTECNNLDSGIIPQLNYNSGSGNITPSLGNIGDNDLVEKDKAEPQNTETGFTIENTENLELNFSEKLSTGSLILKNSLGDSISGITTLTGSKLIFNPDSDLEKGKNYNLEFSAKDFAGNEKVGIEILVKVYGDFSYASACPTTCGLSSSNQTQTVCNVTSGVCINPETRTCPATSACPSSGGGGGGGGFSGPTIGNYVFPVSESDRIVESFDNIDLKNLEDGVLSRPLKMNELGSKYFVEFEKGIKISDEDGVFTGKILAVKKISTLNLPNIDKETREISKGKYALRAIEVGKEEGNLFFDKDIRVTISLSGISSQLNRDFVDIYSYNEKFGIYQLENKNRVYDEKEDSITVSVDHMTKFVAVREDGGAKDSGNNNIGGGNESETGTGTCKIKDISNHWSNEFVLELCNENIVSGEGQTGLFKPDSQINRAALLKMLMISFGYEIEDNFSEKYFQDVNGDERFADYVNTAKKMGLIDGYKKSGNFKITQFLEEKSYGEQVILLQDFLERKGFFDTTKTGYFGGITKIALEKYQESVGIDPVGKVGPETLSKINSELNEIYPESYEFRPAENINRAEALAMILKVAKKSVGFEIGDFNEFQDVPRDSWFANFVKYGFENGIISGKRDGVFAPSGNITKGEVSKIIVKTRDLK